MRLGRLAWFQRSAVAHRSRVATLAVVRGKCARRVAGALRCVHCCRRVVGICVHAVQSHLRCCASAACRVAAVPGVKAYLESPLRLEKVNNNNLG